MPSQSIHISGTETVRGMFTFALIRHGGGLERSKMRKSTLNKWKRYALEVEWDYKPAIHPHAKEAVRQAHLAEKDYMAAILAR